MFQYYRGKTGNLFKTALEKESLRDLFTVLFITWHKSMISFLMPYVAREQVEGSVILTKWFFKETCLEI